MTATATGQLPRHIQVSEMLAREIRAGLYADGSKLHPEREMAKQLGVAVGTLRKALADLTQKGLLERIQGSGNYVRNSMDARTVYSFFRLELVKGGGLPTAEVLSVRKMRKPTDLPDFGDALDVHRIRRLRQLNALDCAVEEIWLDGSYADTVKSLDLSESLYYYYRQALNLWITKVEDAVSVARPPTWTPKTLSSTDRAWGYIERFSFDQNNQAAEFSRTWFNPETTRYIARLA